jgi:hypothetical protein
MNKRSQNSRAKFLLIWEAMQKRGQVLTLSIFVQVPQQVPKLSRPGSRPRGCFERRELQRSGLDKQQALERSWKKKTEFVSVNELCKKADQSGWGGLERRAPVSQGSPFQPPRERKNAIWKVKTKISPFEPPPPRSSAGETETNYNFVTKQSSKLHLKNSPSIFLGFKFLLFQWLISRSNAKDEIKNVEFFEPIQSFDLIIDTKLFTLY